MDPQQLPSKRERLSAWATRFRTPLMLGASLVIAVVAIVFYELIRPNDRQRSDAEIAAVVAEVIESIPPGPSIASHAYRVIYPSLVHVLAYAEEPSPESAGNESPGDESGTPETPGGAAGATGAGVVMADDGTILSSLHVVEGAAVVHVVFFDGLDSEATVVVRQPENDLAVLRAHVIPDDLIPATMASSARLSVGDEVVAVGHPFGISNSVSAGVVSGLRRTFQSPQTGATLSGLIQFDAAVNPGNSGGPLLNRNGEVVGIVAALLNPAGEESFAGIGFAVTIETAAGAAGPPQY